MANANEGRRILVQAPFGRDAKVIESLLSPTGFEPLVCPSLAVLSERLDDMVGAVVIAEEALNGPTEALEQALAAQPDWSDPPFVLLASHRGQGAPRQDLRLRLPVEVTNMVVLDRPVGSESLISAVSLAVRLRRKQYDMRDRLAELASERTRLTTLLENLPIGVKFMDEEGVTVLANSAFHRFIPEAEGADSWTGYDVDGNIVTPEQHPGARALKGEHMTGDEYLIRTPGQPGLWTRVSSLPLYDAFGRQTGAMCVVIDIDEQKRAQQALRRFNEELEKQVHQRTAQLELALEELRAESAERERAEMQLRQSQKMEAVGQLTGGIAHDFNNMLTGVMGAIDVMRRRIAAGRVEDLERFMDAATASARKAASLTQRLLAFSRRQPLDSKPIDVNALVRSLEDLLVRTMTERIRVDLRLASDLPWAIADANQLESAILNLAINARDAMPNGGVLTLESRSVDLTAPVGIRDLEPGRYIVLVVSDNGLGIPPEVIERVFDPFFTTKPMGQGTGLGLSMVYGFARQSNGQVEIESTPGQGTSIRIYLPATDRAEQTSGAGGMAAADGRGQTVLFVEDDPAVRLLVREALEELGYVAIETSEAQEAIRILRSDRPIDLMVSDIGLPGMNGRQLAEMARTLRPGLPILFVTGYAGDAGGRTGFLGPGMAMIAKPFELDLLARKMEDLLAAHRPAGSI